MKDCYFGGGGSKWDSMEPEGNIPPTIRVGAMVSHWASSESVTYLHPTISKYNQKINLLELVQAALSESVVRVICVGRDSNKKSHPSGILYPWYKAVQEGTYGYIPAHPLLDTRRYEKRQNCTYQYRRGCTDL